VLAAPQLVAARPELVEWHAASRGVKAVAGLQPQVAQVAGSGLELRAWAEQTLAPSTPVLLQQSAGRRSEEPRLQE
jgi:hypothetical protein